MAYIKHGFNSGDILKASDLDYIEEGIVAADVNLEKGVSNGSIQQVGFETVDKEGNSVTTLGAIASGEGSVAFGGQRVDKVGGDVADEPQTEAKGAQSFAAGGGVIVNGDWSAGFGKEATTYQKAGFAIGGGTQAGCTEEEYANNLALVQGKAVDKAAAYADSYSFAFASGDSSKAYGWASQAEGISCESWGYGSHAQGRLCKAKEHFAHSGGYDCEVSGRAAFAHGYSLNMPKHYGAAFGKYNEGTTIFEIGMGESDTNRKSVLAVNGNGDLLIYRPGVKNSDGTWSRKPRRYSLSKLLSAIGAFDKVDSWGEDQYTEYDF